MRMRLAVSFAGRATSQGWCEYRTVRGTSRSSREFRFGRGSAQTGACGKHRRRTRVAQARVVQALARAASTQCRAPFGARRAFGASRPGAGQGGGAVARQVLSGARTDQRLARVLELGRFPPVLAVVGGAAERNIVFASTHRALHSAFVAPAPLLTQSFAPAWLCFVRRGHLGLLSGRSGFYVTSGHLRGPPWSAPLPRKHRRSCGENPLRRPSEPSNRPVALRYLPAAAASAAPAADRDHSLQGSHHG